MFPNLFPDEFGKEAVTGKRGRGRPKKDRQEAGGQGDGGNGDGPADDGPVNKQPVTREGGLSLDALGDDDLVDEQQEVGETDASSDMQEEGGRGETINILINNFPPGK